MLLRDVLLVVIAWLLAWSLTGAAIVYAHRHGMLDQPGRRRSHQIPTPRGGGISFVAAVALTVPFALAGSWLVDVGLLAGLLLVASIGWWDDHHPLRPLPRFCVQIAAVVFFLVATFENRELGWWWAFFLLAGGWSINLHNFMDGIDGLLAQQAIFVFLGYALLASADAAAELVAACLCVAAAVAGFWIYNRTPARIFMGDVGSGSLGFLVFAFGLLLWVRRVQWIWPILILSSAFVTDATLTLLWRMLRGRRWYLSHREHLYQWLVRRKLSHGQVAFGYLGWGICICLPSVGWLAFRPEKGLWICLADYAGAVLLWVALKRHLLQRGRNRGRA